ncbi:pallilysin-related adhesin [Treponema sp. R6D11]
MKKTFFYFSAVIAALLLLLILFLATGLWKKIFYAQSDENIKTKIVTPREANIYASAGQSGQVSWEENISTKIPLAEGETVIAVLNKESEANMPEEQFVVYRTSDTESPVFLTLLGYDENTRAYKRLWNASTSASQSETITIFSQDLIGDRNNCIVVTGMNDKNEHTMTVFRRMPGRPISFPYKKIADLQIAGSVIIQETVRSLAYQQGLTRGQSFNIAAYGQDNASVNILDQIETIYSFNSVTEQYEQINVSRIPGSQVEQRRIRELLSGAPGVFEKFINDLWYYVSPQGTIDAKQYIYFDPIKKEIIFFGDEAQQVFLWQTANQTRYGLYIRSQNISISTLLRFVDIELESLDSIKLRVIEDVRLRITANTTWDGSYRRAGSANFKEELTNLKPTIDAIFDSSWGRIQFNNSGEYTVTSVGTVKKGRYIFYKVNNDDLLELRPEEDNENRLVYKAENAAGVLLLSHVKVGINGVQDLLEPPITLTKPIN